MAKMRQPTLHGNLDIRNMLELLLRMYVAVRMCVRVDSCLLCNIIYNHYDDE